MFRDYISKRNLKKECHKKNLKYEIIGKATCTRTYGNYKNYIIYTFMVNGYGQRKITIRHNLYDDILDKGDEYKHQLYVKWYKAWENGALDNIPIDDESRDRNKLWRHDLNFYYQYYIHREEIFVKKIVVKPIEEMVVSVEMVILLYG